MATSFQSISASILPPVTSDAISGSKIDCVDSSIPSLNQSASNSDIPVALTIASDSSPFPKLAIPPRKYCKHVSDTPFKIPYKYEAPVDAPFCIISSVADPAADNPIEIEPISGLPVNAPRAIDGIMLPILVPIWYIALAKPPTIFGSFEYKLFIKPIKY